MSALRDYLKAHAKDTQPVNIMDREKGDLENITQGTLDEVIERFSTSTGEVFYAFTIREDANHFYFAPSSFKKQIKALKENGFSLIGLNGINIQVEKKPLDDNRYWYKVTLS